MEAKKSNKIKEIVKLQQILKKWQKRANASKSANSNNNSNNSSSNGSKSIKFLKRTLSLSETSAVLKRTLSLSDTSAVPKGYLAVSVGEEQKRYTIPTDYLSHQAFQVLLHEAEEEFGFQQTGVLRIPCEVPMFENILKIMEEKKGAYLLMQECRYIADETSYRRSSDCQSPMCR